MRSLRSCGVKLSVLALGLMACSGCFGPPQKKVVIGKVSGKVTLDGEPISAGCVLTFMPKSAGADVGSGIVNEEGGYVATSGKHPGIPIGDYRVLVLPPRMDPAAEAEQEKQNYQVVMNALLKKDKKELQKVQYAQDAVVPRKYWTESTTDLICTVAEGENTADFELIRSSKN